MGTLVEISVVAPRDKALESASAAIEEIKRVERLTSYHMEGARLAMLNASSGSGPVPVDEELFRLIELSLDWARKTSGAFDPTIGAVSELWSFSGRDPKLPDKSELERALKSSGWRRVELDKEAMTISIPKGMALDLGAIAKGYALDMGAQKLRSHGISSALINAGGDIASIGVKRPGKPWRIGVQDPDLGRSIIAVIPLENRSVVTSGDYERFFEIRGARYHHILDPKTGYPAQGTRSVTIVADEAVNADALATAVFVMGGEKGMEFLNNLKNVAGMIMDGSGKLWVTQGDEGVFDLKGPKD